MLNSDNLGQTFVERFIKSHSFDIYCRILYEIVSSPVSLFLELQCPLFSLLLYHRGSFAKDPRQLPMSVHKLQNNPFGSVAHLSTVFRFNPNSNFSSVIDATKQYDLFTFSKFPCCNFISFFDFSLTKCCGTSKLVSNCFSRL